MGTCLQGYNRASHIISNSEFYRNYAVEGGVFLVEGGSTITCHNCTFTQNFAYKAGIAMVLNNAILKFNDSVVVNNSALQSKS